LKRSTLIFIMVLSLLIIPVVLSADENSHGKTLEAVLEAIRIEQNVTQNKDINPDKVSDDLLEELGEAVMSIRHPNERVHEMMDNMMGGEGSVSLRSAHIMMGYNYLTGNLRGSPYPRGIMGKGWGMPMMGNYGGWGMHPFFWGGGILMVIGFILLLGGVAAIIITMIRRKNNSGSAIEILKKRLAKGEITKDEYEKLKHDVI